MKWLEDNWMNCINLSLLKAVEAAATQQTPGVGQRPSPEGTHANQGYTPQGFGMLTPGVESLLMSIAAT